MIESLASLIPLALLGAVLGLDVVSFPQAMISRPLVAATLGGALVGQAGRGLIAGVVLELFALETLPFGASRYPEWGSAAVVGGALYALQSNPTPGSLAISVFAALITASVGGWSMVQHRRLLARWAGTNREALAAGSTDAIVRMQLQGLCADLIRAGLLTALGMAVWVPLTRALLATWTVAAVPSRELVVVLAGATAAAAVWKVTHATKGARWFMLAGLLGGCAAAYG